MFRQHGLPAAIISDKDPRLTKNVWKPVFNALATRFGMLTADGPQIDGPIRRVYRFIENIVRSFCADTSKRCRPLLLSLGLR